jgi:hypothetical protein
LAYRASGRGGQHVAETRVDLRHLLEDIRDSYPCPVEEAILSELIANSLDSGCSRIDIMVESEQHRLTIVDNGESMTPKQFEQYHDIASTTKIRGKGIGFAGVGAKLALLVCGEVLTEARRPRRCLASRWWLESDYRAPWEDMASAGIVSGDKGTGVRLHFGREARSVLLSADSVCEIIERHFYPLLDHEFAKVLCQIYPEGVAVTVNGERITVPQVDTKEAQYFVVRRGRRRKPTGIGFLVKSARRLPEDHRGLAISTFGKVIKRGWEWLGVTPRNPGLLTGIVEVPELVQCLTTNKCDFMRDPNSLQKYYKYRKGIQDAVMAVLDDFGERRQPEARPDRSLRRLQREIEGVVAEILPEFPELVPLFGRKPAGAGAQRAATREDGDIMVGESCEPDACTASGGEIPGTAEAESLLEKAPNGSAPERDGWVGEPGARRGPRRRRPGLMIGFDSETGGDEMAWLRGNTLYINALHPAYKRVQGTGMVGLYITFAVATTLSAHVETGRAPLDLMQRFMAAWGEMA